jgi:putative membrane protein
MMLRWLLASFHLLALGVGLGAVWVRGRGLRGPLDPSGLRRVFLADSVWGLAALLWISTGLWRLLGGTEKATDYYLHNHAFLTKMGLFLLILVLEVWPMATLIRWRVRLGRGELPDTRAAPVLARISFAQAWIVVLMVFAATAMARGLYGHA